MKTILKIFLVGLVLNVSGSFAQSSQEEAMTIDSNGNVGINTPKPTAKLEVKGDIKVSGTTANATIVSDTKVETTTVNATGTIQQNGKDLLPKGAIIMWYGGTSAPAGWAICDGTGGTPDLRGRFVVGVGQVNNSSTNYNFMDTGGVEKVILTENQMPRHTHKITGTNDVQVMYKDTYAIMVQGTDKDGRSVYDRNGNESKIRLKENIALENTGDNQPHENLPPYYALYYIIKL